MKKRVPSIAEIGFTLQSRRKRKKKAERKARQVRQRICVRCVELRDGKGGTVQANCIVAKDPEVVFFDAVVSGTGALYQFAIGMRHPYSRLLS